MNTHDGAASDWDLGEGRAQRVAAPPSVRQHQRCRRLEGRLLPCGQLGHALAEPLHRLALDQHPLAPARSEGRAEVREGDHGGEPRPHLRLRRRLAHA